MTPATAPDRFELVQTVIDAEMLDTIGKSFRFEHGKGSAEWFKNALDNYLRRDKENLETRAGAWPLYVDLIDAPKPSQGPNMVLVDFGGTTLRNIESFLLVWGSRSAATLGNTVVAAGVTGGHGNGGKFYMREMWRNGARFLTFWGGKATSLVVEKRPDKNSGYWEFKDRPMAWRAALDAALPESEHLGGTAKLIAHMEAKDPDLVAELDGGARGLTVIVGRRAVQLYNSNDLVRGGRWDIPKLVEAIRNAPQARRPIRELAISVFHNGDPYIERLRPETIEEDPEWPAVDVEVPIGLVKDAALAGNATTAGVLRLRKALEALSGRRKHHNAITVLEQHDNPIASYAVRTLPLPNHSSYLDFVFGELELTFPGLDDLVQNDRVQLVDSGTTKAIIEWVAERVWERVAKVEKAQRESAKKSDLEIASILNDHLNKYATRFLQKLESEIFVDVVPDPQGGGEGPHPHGPPHDGPREPHPHGPSNPNGHTGGEGPGGKREVTGESERARRPRFPQILLSDYDPDPATGNTETKKLTEGHPPVWQDDPDKEHNVWWINTSHLFAREALKLGPRSAVFKSYQLHMVRDVVQHEVLRLEARKQQELLLDVVENECMSEISHRFLTDLSEDLMATILE